MAALVEGVEYGLSSLGTNSSNKSVLHVKLTDSALRAIEEYTSFKGGQCPKISFRDTGGTICIPSKSQQDGERAFNFSLSRIQGDPKGSFDCVQQHVVKSRSGLDLIGSMSQKMTIHANEDSYKTTRDRMAIAEEESKKSCAKEIKRGGPNMGKRVKVTRRHDPSSSTSGPTAPPPPSSRHFSPIDRPSPTTAPPPPPISRDSTTSTGRLATTPVTTNNHSSSAAPSSIVTASAPANNHVHRRPSPQPDRTTSGPTVRHRMSPSLPTSQPASKPAHPDVLKKPLRERIIHLLAVKPYKKPEMILRLTREGLKEKDKSQISVVLQQVGVFSTKGNAYSLAKHLYGQVKLDWPDYKEDDIAKIKKRLALENRSSTPPSVSPAVSPVHSIGSQGGSPTNPSHAQKRQGDAVEGKGPQSKKARVAHSSRRHGSNSANAPSNGSGGGGNSNHTNTNHTNNRSPSRATSRAAPQSPSVQPPAPAAPVAPVAPAPTTTTMKHNSDSSSRVKHPPLGVKSSPSSNHINMEEDDADDESDCQENNNNLNRKEPQGDVCDIENQDFVKDYSKIDSMKQRSKYKNDFYREYEEYRELHSAIAKSTHIFQDLRSRLYEEEEGSLPYENIKNQIYQEYRALKKDPQYGQNRQRCEYLHHKLGHIKRLIRDYDNKHLVQS